MAETLSTLSVISFAAGGVCLGLATFLWFFFKIPAVIGDLSGRTARKSIAKMRAANEKTGAKSFQESKTNAARGRLTDGIPDLDPLDQRPETGLLEENQRDGFRGQSTGDLEQQETEILGIPEQWIPNKNGGKKLVMLEEVVLIHTDEVIE